MSRFAIALFCALFALPAYARPHESVQTQIFQYFMAKAQNGDPNAEYIVGTLYETGKGVQKDDKEAKRWYGKAAAQGNQLAKDKLDHTARAAQEAARAKEIAAAKAASERAAAARARMRAEVAARARIAAERAARARLAAEHVAAQKLAAAREVRAQRAAQRTIDALPIVLDGNWYHSEYAAPYLPSSKTSCLQAGSSEIVCFSQRLHRDFGGSALTFTVKSTLSHFGRQGNFTIKYLYDVVDVSGDSSGTASNDITVDPPAARIGWQPPGHTLRCHARGLRTLVCTNQQHRTIEFAKR